MIMIKWFRKKKEEKFERPKMNFEGLRMKLNIRSILYYETVRAKSFFSADMNEEDVVFLIYSMLKENNDIDLSFDGFVFMLQDERVLRWCVKQTDAMRKEASQLSLKKKDEGGDDGERSEIKMTDVANYLIVKGGLDVRYVMDDMKMWEISVFMEGASSAYEDRLTEQRLWTYLTILPNVDGKKLKGPEQLLPFPWDSKENRKDKELAKNAQKAINFLKKQQKEKDGEG